MNLIWNKTLTYRCVFIGGNLKSAFFLNTLYPFLVSDYSGKKYFQQNFMVITVTSITRVISVENTAFLIHQLHYFLLLLLLFWQAGVFITLLPHGQILWRGSFCALHSPHYSDHMTSVSMAGVAVVKQISMDWDIKRSLCYCVPAKETK